MILEIYAWAPTREQFIDGMLANRFMVEGENGPEPTSELEVDEIGPITRISGTDENGEPTYTTVPGWHVNLRCYGSFADAMIHGLPQTDEAGNMLGAFERSYILHMVPDLEWTALEVNGVPAGYEGPHGVRLYDPAVVQHPFRVRA